MTDLLLHRYGALSEIENLPAHLVVALILKANEAEFEARAHAQWTALLPMMQRREIEYESFQAYYDRLTGKNMDLRPANDIMAEVAQIRAELEE